MELEQPNIEKIDFKKKFDLSKKVIIVTGAAGLIGNAFCEAICQFGGIVIAVDIQSSKPEYLATVLSKNFTESFADLSFFCLFLKK